MRTGVLHVDDDYEMVDTKFKQDASGNYELIDRPDLRTEVKTTPIVQEDIPSFFKSDLSDKKRKFMSQFHH